MYSDNTTKNHPCQIRGNDSMRNEHEAIAACRPKPNPSLVRVGVKKKHLRVARLFNGHRKCVLTSTGCGYVGKLNCRNLIIHMKLQKSGQLLFGNILQHFQFASLTSSKDVGSFSFRSGPKSIFFQCRLRVYHVMQHIMAYHLQIAVDMFKNFVGGVVFTSANIWSRNLVTRMTIIHRRLQQQYTYIVNDHYKRRQDLNYY